MSCCDQAAEYLIDALGGESATKKIVGGTKWWQIRGVNGCGVISGHSGKELIYGCFSVDGEWIVAKKDWQEAKKRAESKERKDKSRERREKEREKSSQQSTTTDSAPAEDTSEPGYTPDMDEQRCILYFHGGKPQCGFILRVTCFLTWTPFDFYVGGYYFGSVDQERYSIQRFARKINGRVFGKIWVSRQNFYWDCHNIAH